MRPFLKSALFPALLQVLLGMGLFAFGAKVLAALTLAVGVGLLLLAVLFRELWALVICWVGFGTSVGVLAGQFLSHPQSAFPSN
jgi:hypothetical protein